MTAACDPWEEAVFSLRFLCGSKATFLSSISTAGTILRISRGSVAARLSDGFGAEAAMSRRASWGGDGYEDEDDERES